MLTVQGGHLARKPEFGGFHAAITNSLDKTSGVVRQEFSILLNGAALKKEREKTYSFLGLHDVLETALARIVDVLKKKDSELPLQIESAAARLKESTTESYSQAAVTCRRMLKAYADAVYPPTASKLGSRDLDEAHYVNRIWQFIDDRAKHKQSRQLVQNTLESLGQRVDAIYEISFKGAVSDFFAPRFASPIIFFGRVENP
jgi:hypothetical protein